jgi:hypothetical protein
MQGHYDIVSLHLDRKGFCCERREDEDNDNSALAMDFGNR